MRRVHSLLATVTSHVIDTVNLNALPPQSPLSRTNAALRTGLERLAGEFEPRAILRQVIGAMISSTGAHGGALFELRALEGTLSMTEVVNPAWPADGTPASALALFSAPADVTPYWSMLLAARRPLVLDAEDPAQTHLFWPGTREWHLAHRQPIAIGMALQLGDEPLGMVGLTLERHGDLTDERLELLPPLAHQATLALHLTRVHEQARHAAIERERQEAELARATERQRLSNDLHDTLTQDLSAIVLQLRAAKERLPAAWYDAPELAGSLELARSALGVARAAVRRLRDEHADSSDGDARSARTAAAHTLVDAVRELTAGNARVSFRLVGEACPLPLGVTTELHRIVHAALSNALRHSRATTIAVQLDFGGGADEVVATVSDDGVGFDPRTPHHERYGLVGMRERAARIGARLSIHSRAGHGTVVRATWPAESGNDD